MSNPFTYAFGTTSFHPVAQDQQPMVEPGKQFYEVRHIPYSTLNVVDNGGVGERRYKTRVRVTPDKVAEWEALKGSTAPLTVGGTYYPTAFMADLSNHTMTPHGEFHEYDCDWIVA